MGWLINGVWISNADVSCVEFMILNTDGSKWIKAETIEQWRNTAEDRRALQLHLKENPNKILVERPKTIERYDVSNLMWSDTQQMPAPGKRPDAVTGAQAPAGLPAETLQQLTPTGVQPKPALVADGNLTA